MTSLVEFTEDITELLAASLEHNPAYQRAHKIVRRNALGKLWLNGGAIYRPLAALLYHVDQPRTDFDFVAERITGQFVLPDGWTLERTSFGNPRFRYNGDQIDLIPLDRGQSIEGFMSYAPLTIQSIAYDVKKGELIGNAGIAALQRKEVAVHDRSNAIKSAARKGISVRGLLQQKADSLGFRAILSAEDLHA